MARKIGAALTCASAPSHGHTVELIEHSAADKPVTGEVVVLAVQITLAAGDKLPWTGGFAVVS